jgi:hypothetical protein
MKKFLSGVIFLFAIFSFTGSSYAYTFVGSWYVDDGPGWSNMDNNSNYTTPVLSGQEAAAFIFGGSPEDYVISTVSDKEQDINFKAWMDGWADSNTYAYSGNPAPQDLHIDIDGDGLYAIPGGYQNAYSAYIMDHGVHLKNFAFKVDSVPEPATILLIGSGIIGLAGFRRKFKKS